MFCVLVAQVLENLVDVVGVGCHGTRAWFCVGVNKVSTGTNTVGALESGSSCQWSALRMSQLQTAFGSAGFELADAHELVCLAQKLNRSEELVAWLARNHGSTGLGVLSIINVLLNLKRLKMSQQCVADAIGSNRLYSDYIFHFADFLVSQNQYVKACNLFEWLAPYREDDKALYLIWSKSAYRIGDHELYRRVCSLATTQLRDASEFEISEIRARLYQPEVDRQTIHAASRSWASKSFENVPRAPLKVRPEHSRPRVGLLADYIHPMFIGPLLAAYDSEKVEVELITNDARASQIYSGQVHALDIKNPKRAVEMLRSLELDVLIEMTGRYEELRLMAERPARIQGSWIATNLTQGPLLSDFVLADPVLIPKQERHDWSEKIIDMPVWAPFQFYSQTPEIGVCPSQTNGFVTFGACQRAMKFNDTLLSLWADLLSEVSESRLVLKDQSFADASVREVMLERCFRAGISLERVCLEEGTPHPAYYDYYNTIDITLDTYPYGGGILTAESLWMGVPVVTLSGDRFNSRLAASYLTALGREEWITRNRQAYISIAKSLAESTAVRRAFRRSARDEMMKSPIMDYSQFARAWEESILELIDGL